LTGPTRSFAKAGPENATAAASIRPTNGREIIF
jgi:hypothetical protein